MNANLLANLRREFQWLTTEIARIDDEKLADGSSDEAWFYTKTRLNYATTQREIAAHIISAGYSVVESDGISDADVPSVVAEYRKLSDDEIKSVCTALVTRIVANQSDDSEARILSHRLGILAEESGRRSRNARNGR
jgi:hypothetical protein